MSKGTRDFRIYFDVPELGEAIRQIGAYDGKAATRIENAVKQATKNIKEGAKARVPVRTGALKKSISARFHRKSVTGYVKAGSYNGGRGGGVPYAHLVEFGAKATTVKPVKAKALNIGPPGAEAAGLNEFARKVQIPKRNERPFMRPAFEEEKPNLIRAVKEAVQPDH